MNSTFFKGEYIPSGCATGLELQIHAPAMWWHPTVAFRFEYEDQPVPVDVGAQFVSSTGSVLVDVFRLSSFVNPDGHEYTPDLQSAFAWVGRVLSSLGESGPRTLWEVQDYDSPATIEGTLERSSLLLRFEQAAY